MLLAVTMIMVLPSCGGENQGRNNQASTATTKQSSDSAQLTHQGNQAEFTGDTSYESTSATVDGFKNGKFKCSIVKNENVNKPQYVQADEAPSCELGLGAKSTRDDDQFRWAVRFTPKGDEYYRRVRMVVMNTEELPGIIRRVSGRASSHPEVEFEVDLRRNIINDNGKPEPKYLCAEGSKWGQTVAENVSNDPGCNESLLVREWVKQNKKGRIVIELKPRGLRRQSFAINYHLDCDVNEWWKQVGGGVVGGTAEFLNRWINGVLSPTRVREVLTRSGCA